MTASVDSIEALHFLLKRGLIVDSPNDANGSLVSFVVYEKSCEIVKFSSIAALLIQFGATVFSFWSYAGSRHGGQTFIEILLRDFSEEHVKAVARLLLSRRVRWKESLTTFAELIPDLANIVIEIIEPLQLVASLFNRLAFSS